MTVLIWFWKPILGELHRLAEHYYRFKICTPKDSVVSFTLLKKGKSLEVIKKINFNIAKAPDPAVYFSRNYVYPVGIRVLLENGVSLDFVVKTYQFEVIKKDGTKTTYMNYGSELTDNGFAAYRQLQEGDSFRVTNILARNECEAVDRRITETAYYIVKK